MTTGRGFLLGTGSRYAPLWLQETITKRLVQTSESARLEHGVRHLTVVHGDAKGSDKVMKAWAMQSHLWAIDQKPFQADWDAPCTDRCEPGHRRARPNGTTYCPAEGCYRNGRMVDYLAEMRDEGHWTAVLSFFENPRSVGTLDCVRQARARGFEVSEYGNAPSLRAAKERQAMLGLRP